MRAFIIRPFGEKSGINFDRVEAELIHPVLARLEIEGRTTGDVIAAGNIREDMFQLLLVSDIVVADISIDNANTYYELGIRHALREKRTFLIRARGMTGDVPFDLRTDRYLAYDPAKPADAIEALHAGLKATLDSERQDSPVFRVLPELREQHRSKFLSVPRGFREEVEYAARSKMRGKLALLGQEARGSLWECEGLRLVGREQFRARSFEAAGVTFEVLRLTDPEDCEVNLLLGTIYERLGDLRRSEEALRRVVDSRDSSTKDRAEAFSLLGRNLKKQWWDSWREVPQNGRRERAFDSPLLTQSFEAYSTGFRHDLNHFYSGLNALAMLTVTLELAAALPDAWQERFANDADANREMTALETERRALAGAVDVSIRASLHAARRSGQPDPWIGVSHADLQMLTADRAGAVARAYQDALQGQPELFSDSVRVQLRLYEGLDLLRDKVARVMALLPPSAAARDSEAATRTILFAGHKIDVAGRPEPRFPPEKEPIARAAIRDAVEREAARPGGVVGIAGGASGGDILFHEVCAELGVPSTLYLALPPDDYVRESVAPAGGDWIRRFNAILQRSAQAPPVLARTKELPGWLQHRAGYTIWQRNNLWLLHEALAAGARQVTVVALWNRKKGDGPGGTADMIQIAAGRGAETHVLDTNAIFT